MDFPTIQVYRRRCRRIARDDGPPRRDRSRSSSRRSRAWTTCPPRRLRARPRSRFSSISRETRHGAALDVQSAISAAGRQLPPTCPRRRPTARSTPADQPVMYLTLTSKICRVAVGRVRRGHEGAAYSTVPGWRRCRLRSAEVRRARSAGSRELASRGIGVDEVAEPFATPREPADGDPVRAVDLLHGAGKRPDLRRFRLPAGNVSYLKRLAVRLADVGHVIDASRRQGRGLVQRRAVDLAGDLKQPARTRSPWPRPSASPPTFRSSFRPPPRCHPLRTVRSPSGLGPGRAHAAPDPRQGRAGHLSIPAKALGDRDPSTRSPFSIVGTVSVMY